MIKDRKVFTNIYCKIFTDSFSEEMVNRTASGPEIFEFLIRDAQQCFDDDDCVIPGDANIWYLGCNEKFGHLQFGIKIFRWNFGQSSFDRVEKFVSMIHEEGLFTEHQFQTLMDKINEGRLIDNMYDITDYLICKRDGRMWTKTEEALKFRDQMKDLYSKTTEGLEREGYQVDRH